MPSGWKKKKSSKKKKNTAAAGSVVNLSSKNIDNVKDKVPIAAEEENEEFETPKLQIDHGDSEELNLFLDNVKDKVPIAAEEENEEFETPKLQPDHGDSEELNSKDAAGNETAFDIIEKEVILEKIERNVEEDVDVVDNEKPEVLIDEVEASSLNEKETETVPQQEEKTDVQNEDANVNLEGSNNKRLNIETKMNDGLKSNSEKLGGEIEQIVQVREISNVVDSSQEMAGHIDENLDTLNEETHENHDSLICAKEAEKSSTHVEKTEILERTEVVYGPPVVRRATFWNCCGLFDLIASSDS